MNLAGRILRLFHWSVALPASPPAKCVVCVAPHTSNWDFVLGKLAYASQGRRARFLMKKEWFFFPLGYLLRAMGGIAVDRRKGQSLTAALVELFRDTEHLHLAITPEGTRSCTAKWRTGFLRVARDADIPILIGIIDYKRRHIDVGHPFTPTGDIEADMKTVKAMLAPYRDAARYPDKFCI